MSTKRLLAGFVLEPFKVIARLACLTAAATLFVTSDGSAQVRVEPQRVAEPHRVAEANRVAETDRGITPNYGEANGTFPNWHERAFAQLTNRARVDPVADLAACPPATCAEKACYSSATLPLPWRLELNKAARFHSATMGMFPYFAHDTPCALFTDIASRYPATSNGSFASSCSGSGTTLAATRVNRFVPPNDYRGENLVAGSPDPVFMFYFLFHEPDPNPNCGFRAANGHRHNILNNGPAQGIGYEFVSGSPFEGYWTQDFGVGPALSTTRIPSGSHWTSVNHTRDPQGGDTTVEFWANWHDTAGGPTNPTVVLDGVPRAMTLARGTTTSGAYTVSVTGVSTACHEYFFSFTSPASQTIRYPDTGTFGFGNASCVDWQEVIAPPAVTGVVATATSGTNVQVMWSGSCATTCRVYRSQFNNKLVYDLAGTGVSPFNDAGVTGGRAHLYKVRAFNGVESSDSNIDLANTTMYTNTIVADSSIVQEDDINQMRNAADAVRTLAGMAAGSYTHGSGSPLRITTGTLIHGADITELRTNLNAAYFSLFAANLSFTNTITPGSSLVQATDFNEIRTKMQ